MAKKNKAPEVEAGCPAWMATYSDMVTLLMTFFIVLLSMSNTDEAKFNAFLKSFSNLPDHVVAEIVGDVEPHDQESDPNSDVSQMDELFSNLKEYMEEHSLEDSITIMNIDGVVYIRFDSSMFFMPNEYELRQESIPVLSYIGNALKSYEEHIRMVNSLGFTATIDNGSYWMLSGERAATVAIHLNEVCMIPSDLITTMGYGNRYPVAANDNEEGRAQNRRVELIVVGVESTSDFNVEKFLEEYHGKTDEEKEASSTTLDELLNPDSDEVGEDGVEADTSADDTETDESPSDTDEIEAETTE